LEFKEAKTQFDFETLAEYCVAIANERGGHLLLGIGNKPPRPVVGTSAFLDTGKIAETLFGTLGFRVNVESVNHPEGRVVVFDIPSRPPRHPYERKGRYLMRVGESLVPMTTEQINRILKEDVPVSLRRVIYITGAAAMLIICFLSFLYWGPLHRPKQREQTQSVAPSSRQSEPQQTQQQQTQPTPPPPRTYMLLDGNIRFPQDATGNGHTFSAERNFRIGELVHFNYFLKARGPNPIQVFASGQSIYLEPDAKETTQKRIVKEFKQTIAREWKANPEFATNYTVMHEADGGQWNTAFAYTEDGNRRLVTQKDLDDFRTGAVRVFVILQIPYKDNGALHHLRSCQYLVPPATVLGVWHFCDYFNNSD